MMGETVNVTVLEPLVRVEARFKNARLFNAIAEAWVETATTTQGAGVQRAGRVRSFCRVHGLSYVAVCNLLCMRASPTTKLGKQLTAQARSLVSILGKSAEYLFPPELYPNTCRSRAGWKPVVLEMSSERVLSLQQVSADEALGIEPVQHQQVEALETRRRLLSVMKTLTPREELVLKHRFGLSESGEEETIEEVGHQLGVQKERVRQIEAKALRKMRHPRRAMALRGHW